MKMSLHDITKETLPNDSQKKKTKPKKGIAYYKSPRHNEVTGT